MKKIPWGHIIAGVVLVAAGWFASNAYHEAKLAKVLRANERLKTSVKATEAELAQVRAKADEEIAALRGMVTSASTIIAGLEEERSLLQETAEVQEAEIRELRTAEVEELLERYPALKAYDLARDRLIETKNSIIFTLTRTIEEKDEIIRLKDLEIEEQIKIGLTWKRQYEEQLKLRVAIEEQFEHFRPAKVSPMVAFLVGAGAGVAGSFLF